ncbi:MAG: helix-turn-helix domain-containing protein [Mariniblastus sp.]
MVQGNESTSDRNVQNGQLGREIKGKDGSLYSPRTVARAIGVSESSLKRWCDSGKIGAVKTAGGHRRFSQANIIEFLKNKNKNCELRDPTVIGLPSFEEIAVADSTDGTQQMLAALIADDEAQVTKLLMYLFVNGWSIAEIFDQIVSPVFIEIGKKWSSGEIEVFQERRACEICLNALRVVRSVLLAPQENALKAIGGTLEGDHFLLPTLAVELTLTSLGWNANSLGSNLPIESMFRAVEAHRPNLMWVSISHLDNEDEVASRMNQFSRKMPPSTWLVIGGHGMSQTMRGKIENAVCCDNLSQLVTFARTVKMPIEPRF